MARYDKYLVSVLVVIIVFLLGLFSLPFLSKPTKLPSIVAKTSRSLDANSSPSPTVEVVPATTFPVAGWLTYRNDEHGFEFRYPPEYRISPVVTAGRWSVYRAYDDGGEYPTVYFDLIPTPENGYYPNARSLEDYKNDFSVDEYGLRFYIHQYKEYDLPGGKALKESYSKAIRSTSQDGTVSFNSNDVYSEDTWLRYVFFDGQNRFIILKMWNPGEDKMENYWRGGRDARDELFLDRIAETFRFIN